MPDPTVRDYLPWHVVRAKLAARGIPVDDLPGATASNDEEPPPSGVQISEKLPVTDAPESPEGLSFKVYTLEELDRRLGTDPPPVIRPSIGVLRAESAPSPWEPWIKTGKAVLAVLYTLKAWALLGPGRPALKDALRAPGVVLDLELRAAVATVDWKKVGIGLGGGVGVAIVLLFAVLTVAELTDDLKPARSSGDAPIAMTNESGSMPSTTLASGTGGPAATQPAAAQPAVATATPAAPVVSAPEHVDELDSPVRAAPAPAPKPAKKPAAKKGKKAPEVFTP